jgi:hypothetical protein
MNANLTPACGLNTVREQFVAELTNAAYAVALRRGLGNRWLDLELDLWKVLNETVTKWDRHALPPR